MRHKWSKNSDDRGFYHCEQCSTRKFNIWTPARGHRTLYFPNNGLQGNSTAGACSTAPYSTVERQAAAYCRAELRSTT